MVQPQHDQTLRMLAGELHAIGQRLVYLGNVLDTQVTQAAPRPVQPQDTVAPQQLPVSPPEQAATPAPPPLVAPQPREKPGWRLEPTRMLVWIGAGITLLGVVFLLVLAAQAGGLTPGVRVTGGAVLGLLLIATGWWVYRYPGAEKTSPGSEQIGRIAAFALVTTGFTAMFLDVVAATTLYGFLDPATGLGIGLVISVAGLLLADRWRAPAPAIGVVLGSAICAPMITGEPNAMLIAFLMLLQVTATPIQVRRGWRGLAVSAGLPTALAALAGSVWGLWVYSPALAGAVFAAAVLGIVVATITAGARHDAEGTAIGLLVAAPMPAFLAGPLLLERPVAAATAAGLTALPAALWAVSRFLPAFRDWLPARFRACLIVLAMIAAAQATMVALDSVSWGTALLVEALLLSSGALLTRKAGLLLGAICYAAAGFVLATVNEVTPDALLDFGGDTGVRGVLAGLLIAAVAVLLPFAGLRIGRMRKLPDSLPAWLLAGVTLWYGTASAVIALCLLVQDTQGAFFVGHILITLGWAVAAIVLLLRGVRVRHLRIAGLVLFAIAVAKLLLFDLAALDGFARVTVFLCAGLLLLAAGVGYARLLSSTNRP